ncbi:acyltransferase family protein [Comamonas sp. 4034]|uniref:acyltransferase family protein n=1 Tax=Comamonas sp. 4034 TaxID=3156455 RepID=UPI003D257699
MIEYIQILRFIAAIWVAIFHGSMAGMFSGSAPWVDLFINWGYAGVDIFFVISGVIMAHSTRNTPAQPRAAGAFFLIRFSRIYTGWWPAMLLYVIFFKITHQLGPEIDLKASFFLYFTELSGLINIAIWSLMFELYFYIIITISLLLQKQHRTPFLGLLFTALILINLYLFIDRSTADIYSNPNWIQMFYIAPIVAEFFMGHFLYGYVKKTSCPSWKTWGFIAILLISLTIYSAPRFANHPYGLANLYYWPERAVLIGGAALAIVGMALKLPPPQNKIARALAILGDYSYSIYLLHILAFGVMLSLLPLGNFDNHFRTVISVATILILLLASAAYYHWVEHPAYMFFRNRISRLLTPSSQ